MTILFVILIILAAIVLGLVVLIQNPKGGGLAGNIAGISNQFMGVKQTTDVLEKGTWIFAGVIGVLCLMSAMFIDKKAVSGGGENKGTKVGGQGANQQAPANNPANPVFPGKLPDSTK
jgi:preprotein translocase subunit SecG